MEEDKNVLIKKINASKVEQNKEELNINNEKINTNKIEHNIVEPIIIKEESIETSSILEYLTNPAYYNIISKNRKNMINNMNINNKQEVKFYRKRIIALTKDMLKGAVPSEGLKEIHDEYVKSIIKYFKILDKTDIIQDQYNNISDEVKDSSDNFKDNDDDDDDVIIDETLTIDDANELIMKKPVVTSNLNNFVISTATQQTDTRIIPVKLEIDLNSPSLKRKGIKPKKYKKNMKETSLTELLI